jgi:hypothetical protein
MTVLSFLLFLLIPHFQRLIHLPPTTPTAREANFRTAVGRLDTGTYRLVEILRQPAIHY